MVGIYLLRASSRLFIVALLIFPDLSFSQPNSFLKKYAGSYYILPFGVETPTATSEKLILTADGKWSSVGFPLDKDDIPSKVPVKNQGSWKADDGQLQIRSVKNGKELTTDYKLDAGLFIGSDTYLDPIFISNPIYLKKYSGVYYLLNDGQEQPLNYATIIKLGADGVCSIISPTMDDNGVVGKPTSVSSIWKAREGSLQVFLKEDENNKPTSFEFSDNFFRSKNGYYLKKVPPPPPPNPYLKLYAGTYYMLVDGQQLNSETDKYVFTPDGKATWTIYVRANADGTVTKAPFTRTGTWQASEVRIQWFIAIEDYDMCDVPVSDFKLQNGVFRYQNIYLKKAAATQSLRK
ncbi:MAG TPA: hypothetical protein DGG95_08460 [Cytophagales bacterium]|nr:hypothetical protein [Cytophagales bacterium]